MKIYRTTDRISVKIDDVTIKLAPLTLLQKSEIQTYLAEASKGKGQSGLQGAMLAVKYSLKDIKGVEDQDGNPYELKFDGDVLADECVEELLNSEISDKMMITCSTLAVSIRDTIINPITNKPLEGVKILKNAKRGQKK